MPFDPNRHHRHSIRLRGYDYSQPGGYFVTICTHNRELLFGEIANGDMLLGNAGQIVKSVWEEMPNHHPGVDLDAFVIMPNHIHGIIVIGAVGTRRAVSLLPSQGPRIESFGKPVPGSLPTVVRSFKSAVTERVNEARSAPGRVVWQRNYYEHVVRDEDDLRRIHQYIIDNPRRWGEDEDNPVFMTP